MSDGNRSWIKGLWIAVAVMGGLPFLAVVIVSLQTWAPLQEANRSLETLKSNLGASVAYTPIETGAISADRMELFLALRTDLAGACEDYGSVQRGFESVESLTPETEPTAQLVGGTVVDLGRAAFAITPFLARYFEARNAALLEASMSLEEYSYIYAMTYHEQLLSEDTRSEIFSDGDALSPEASAVLKDCLRRQAEHGSDDRDWNTRLEKELHLTRTDPGRLIWEDGMPAAILASVEPYRDRLDALFCSPTAGLELEHNARRALRVALE